MGGQQFPKNDEDINKNWIDPFLEFQDWQVKTKEDPVPADERVVIIVRDRVGGFEKPRTKSQISRIPRKLARSQESSCARRAYRIIRAHKKALSELGAGRNRAEVLHELEVELAITPQVGKMVRGIEELREVLAFCARLGDDYWCDYGGGNGLYLYHVR